MKTERVVTACPAGSPLTRLKDYEKHAPKPMGPFTAKCTVLGRTGVHAECVVTGDFARAG